MSFALAHLNKANKTRHAKMSTPNKHYPSLFKGDHTKDWNFDSASPIFYQKHTNGIQKLIPCCDASGFDSAQMEIQPKLRMSRRGDMYELEADRVAEQVVRTSVPDSIDPMAIRKDEGQIDRKCGAYKMNELKEEEILNVSSRKPKNVLNLEAYDGIANEIDNTHSSSGSPLDVETKDFMESRFGYDFSRVKIHRGEMASRSANAVNALAFTIGNHITFGANQYMPKTTGGKLLLAHELAHVIQQRHERAPEFGSTLGIRQSPSYVPMLQRQSGNGAKDTEPKILKDFAAKFPAATELIRRDWDAFQLVTEAEKAGAIFGGYAEEGPYKNSWAYTDGYRVYVPKVHTDPVVAIVDFLFELNNAIRKPRFEELDKEATKGTKGKLTAEQYAYKNIELEVEGMLNLGEIWFEMKKTIGKDIEWNKYDNEFYLGEYQEFKEGKKTKDDIVKEVLKREYSEGKDKGKTHEQYYKELYKNIAGGK